MLDTLRKIFIYNGFERDELRGIRNELVEVTLESFKKLAMGIGVLYIFAIIIERDYSHTMIDAAYLICFTIFMLLVRLYYNNKKNQVAEFAIMFFMIGTLCIAIYESTFLNLESKGVFFLIFMVLFAVMFTGNPFAIDIILFIMTATYLITSYNLKSPFYFHQDLFAGIFTYLISNMVNAMVARSRTKMILNNKEVEAGRKRYQDIYETAPCGILEYKISGADRTIININQQGLNLYGYSKEEFMKKGGDIIVSEIHQEDRGYMVNKIKALKAVGESFDYEYRLRNRTGSFIWIVGKCRVTAVDESGITVINACINIDAEKKAIDANEAKSRFLSRMSHDIRTPMNAIIGITDIVLDTPDLDNDVRAKMNDIKSSSGFLLGLINDVLDVSKIEADEMKLHPEPYSRFEFINYLNTMIGPLCEQKKIEFTVESSKCSYIYVMLDKVRFNQIFFNLLSNAVKFTPSGGKIYVGMEHVAELDDKIKERIVISDTGIGMSEEFRQKMFDPFSQENSEHISENQGTGLGLAIVKRIVDLMDGTINVESELGKGTKYTIDLLLEPCDAPEVNSIDEDFTTLKGKRVLLCEDHPINQKIARALLEKVGIKVEIASDGAEGMQMFKASTVHYYDAILMDIRMPVIGGLEATVGIRNSEKEDAKTIPIIAMTANVFDTDREKSISVGMNAHISKPIEPIVLYSTLKRYVK